MGHLLSCVSLLFRHLERGGLSFKGWDRQWELVHSLLVPVSVSTLLALVGAMEQVKRWIKCRKSSDQQHLPRWWNWQTQGT